MVDPSAVTFSGDIDSEAKTVRGVLKLDFSLRINRDACSWSEGAIRIGVVSREIVSGHDRLQISRTSEIPELTMIAPVLPAPNPSPPRVSILVVDVEPVRFSLTDQVTTGTATITVLVDETPCNAFVVFASLQDDFVASPSTSLVSVVVDGGPLSQIHLLPGQVFDTAVSIGIVNACSSPGSSTLIVAFELTVPGGLAVGAFGVSVVASIAASSDGT